MMLGKYTIEMKSTSKKMPTSEKMLTSKIMSDISYRELQKLVKKFREVGKLPKNTKANIKKVELQELLYTFEEEVKADLSYREIQRLVKKFREVGKLPKNTKANMKKLELQNLLDPFEEELEEDKLWRLWTTDETLYDSNPHPLDKSVNKEKGKHVSSSVKDKAFKGYMKSYTINGDENENDVDMTFDICKTQLGKILGKELKALKGLEVTVGGKVSYAKDCNPDDAECGLWHQ
jgi:hypothetical protein